MNGCYSGWSKGSGAGDGSVPGERGTVLLTLIVTMVILSVLGAAMFSLFSVSTMSQIGGSSSLQAYYLAESGFRYADSEMAHTSKSRQDDELELLHDTDYLFTGGDKKFNLKIYPYYYRVTNRTSTILDTEVPGGLPPDLSLTSGWLKIDGEIHPYSTATMSGNTVSFTRAIGIWPMFMSAGTTVLSASPPDGSQTVNTVDNYIDLETAKGSANAFPEKNGMFTIHGSDTPTRKWSYEKRTAGRLSGVFPLDDPDGTFSITVDGTGTPPKNFIVLDKYVEVHATGTVYPGDAALETQRKIVYFAPLSDFYKKEYVETFDDKSNWNESALGAHEIKTIDGDSALKVTGTSEVTDTPKASLIEFNWTSAEIDLASAHFYAGEYLSYDTQVKVGFEADPYPVQGYGPEGTPVPKYFVAGINFRLDDDTNAYGLSFLRGDNTIASPYDNIPNEIIPVDDKLCLVLWQQTDGATERTWLAYKDLSSQDYTDDMENGEDDWAKQTNSLTAEWQITDHRSYPAGGHAWYYGVDGAWTYNTGKQVYGYIKTPAISLCGFTTAKLKFWSWYQTEDAPAYVNTYDLKYVYILNEAGIPLIQYQIIDRTDPTASVPASPPDKLEQTMNTWNELEIDLTSFVGQVITVQFVFDTRDAVYNDYEGWYIDGVSVTGDFEFPVNEATLMVRLVEAAAVTFTGGTDTGGTGEEIEAGDIVTQSNGAKGTVVGAPILSSGSWSGGNAAGTLLLNNLPRNSDGTLKKKFNAGLLLSVNGKSTVQASVTEFRQRDNYIRAYLADPYGCGAGDDDPFNAVRLACPRSDDIKWPPGNVADWTADDDYFTLVKWDGVNPGVATIAEVSSADEPDVIVRSSESTFLTPDTYTFDNPELGLQTFGHGSTNVYFDDFAVQVELKSSKTGFLPTVQE